MAKAEWYRIEDRRCVPSSYEYDGKKQWHWEAACISSFPGMFDDCEDNYDAERKLRAAGVIHKRNQTDSESCACVVYFSNEASAYKFAVRMQEFIKKNKEKEAA
jgi:hypothetical protein